MSWLRGVVVPSPNHAAFIVSGSLESFRYRHPNWFPRPVLQEGTITVSLCVAPTYGASGASNYFSITKVSALQLFDSHPGGRTDDNGTCRRAFYRERHVRSKQENVRPDAAPCL